MKKLYKKLIFSLLCSIFAFLNVEAQTTVKGKVLDATSGEELIGATVGIVGGGGGTVTDYEGNFILKVAALPVKVKCTYTGYLDQTVDITNDQRVVIKMEENVIMTSETVIVGQRIDEKIKKNPLSVENLDAIAMKEAPASSFYNALGNLKGVDMTTASLGFTIINTRGFNSTSPVRSLQIIDGVDNQAPGLNFSLGNFLGASELDVNKVDLVAGASGPFYGPNAFNGVISIESKNPFLQKGLSVSLKSGERNLLEGAIRWADALKNKDGNEFFAYKFNLFHLRANDWVANNYEPVIGSKSPKSNPGRYDAVNTYGDEYSPVFDNTGDNQWSKFYGMGIYHRTGYNEEDIVDYNTRNLKANATFHFRTQPSKEYDSPELIVASSLGNGTTVYQGDNRFSLRNILFFQNRLEFRKKDKYFIRAYATNEDAGNSYDPYFTALRLQQNAKTNDNWRYFYNDYWTDVAKFQDRMTATGYPQLKVEVDPVTFEIKTSFDYDAANRWFANNQDSLSAWHTRAAAYADNSVGAGSKKYFRPGTPEFQEEFDRITKTKSGRAGGTRFFDKSALYHVHGEYRFAPKWANYWVVGGNFRQYTPYSEGTIFSDTLQYTRNASGAITDSSYLIIRNREGGVYTGVEKKFMDNRLTFAGTLRADKNQNFNLLLTPAASVVYNPSQKDFLRFSFSSAIRNPTLTDQYLFLNVGRAILLGNLNGFDSLITIESFSQAIENPIAPKVSDFKYFNVAPIRPEKVKSFELGYRTTFWDRLYMDAGYYFSIYNDFIGYNIGIDVPVSQGQVDINQLQVYRVAANSTNQVTTQGFNVGLNFYFRELYSISGNYSWNKLNKLSVEDPIIPAFNTPEHKFNIGFSGRDVKMGRLKQTGFSVTYKWIKGFEFEGSPQFTGFIPTYDMVDAQWNCKFPKVHTTLKIGATNIFGFAPLFRDDRNGQSALKAMFNNAQFQTYGGPRIGRMAYISLVYNFEKR